MARLGEHPRLAAMLLQAQALGVAYIGCLLAALVSERGSVLPRESCQSADVSVPVAALLLQAQQPPGGGTPFHDQLQSTDAMLSSTFPEEQTFEVNLPIRSRHVPI